MEFSRTEPVFRLPVAEDSIADTLLELEQRFGAVSCETQTIHGHWRHGDEAYRHDLIRVFIDVDDLPEHREFFLEFKERMKARFAQRSICGCQLI